MPPSRTGAHDRPTEWAQPQAVEGVPNLYRVDAALFRSAQPSASGMANLKALGIETIVNLRAYHSDRDEIGHTGLAYEHIYMRAWRPREKHITRFLQIVTNPRRSPVLVHCWHGADRTGVMCALYRMVVHRWNRDEAIREMTQGGFGYHTVWKNIVPFVRDIDIDRIRALAFPSSHAQ